MTTSVGEHRAGWVADDSTFGARLALIRQRMAWGNVKEAADECGLPAESWRRWERDGRAPRNVVEIAVTISEKTGCDLGWLVAGARLRRGGLTVTSLGGPIFGARPTAGRPPNRPNGRRPPLSPNRTSRLRHAA
jgi:hypothetical protein